MSDFGTLDLVVRHTLDGREVQAYGRTVAATAEVTPEKFLKAEKVVAALESYMNERGLHYVWDLIQAVMNASTRKEEPLKTMYINVPEGYKNIFFRLPSSEGAFVLDLEQAVANKLLQKVT